MKRVLVCLLVVISAISLASPAALLAANQVAYQLPVEGPLPKTYRVTLAIVDAKNPDWIISQFIAGEARTVTAENQGKFSDAWDGLDDNFMPVPPGAYAVKGIFMPAKKWEVDGEYHSITPRFVTGASAFMPRPEQWNKPEPFGGDPCGAPLGDVAVGPNGMAVFYYVYLENGLNNPVIDLNKPVGYEQVVRSFGSGGAGGGTSTTTDGETIWSYSTDGGPKYVYRADGKPFGTGSGQRRDVYRPNGWVTAMASWRDASAKRSFVYVAERGKIIEHPAGNYVESDRDFVSKITVLAGESGEILAEVPLLKPLGLATCQQALFAVHATDDGGFALSSVPLRAGVPQGAWQRLFTLAAPVKPQGIAVDSRNRIYVSDARGNKILQFDRKGTLLKTFGRLAAQKPGAYDPQSFIEPGKLAAWTDAKGNDRLIVVEDGGPNRASEWSDDGKLLREFLSLQTKANDGYAIDPDNPNHVYIAGQKGWLTRFNVDYDKAAWTVDAVWPEIGTDEQSPTFDHPQFVKFQGRKYLACARSYNVYRQEGDRWLLSAAIIRKLRDGKWVHYAWHDANGDGRVQEEEYRDSPLPSPAGVLRYHGEQWLDDLSLLAVAQGSADIWRLAPESFDAHGNPIFRSWQKLLSDPVFAARTQGKADAVHGGNELDTVFSSDWAMADGLPGEDFYVNARGGHSFSANEGSQEKISRYVPDGQGGYRLKWRTGRATLQGVAKQGEIYGAIHLRRPIGGLLSVVDQSRCGILLYNEDGLYVDTIFPDERRVNAATSGIYRQPGEFFAGMVYPHRTTGKIYIGMGKFTPVLYEAEGWSLTKNPVRPLTQLQKTITITAGEIASPPEIALSVRGGAGAARVARFSPAAGGASLDGSMAGWESCAAVQFGAEKDQTVEVRCLYDQENLYLRWHARLSGDFDAKALEPIERIFTHDRLSDTLSFYIQGDPQAKPGGPSEGRSGDVRIVFGIFKTAGDKLSPVALGMYPHWDAAAAKPQIYRTPVGTVRFAHVAPVAGAKLHHVLDEDGKGFVIAAAIPRAAIPQMPALDKGLRTMVNFEATLSGHNKFWWANRDGSASRETYDEPTEARLYPGSWAPAEFQTLGEGIVVRNWMICGPWGGAGAEKFHEDLGLPGEKERARAMCEPAKYPPDDGEVDLKAVFRGEAVRGYWRDPGEVRWNKATIADLDTRVVLGPSAQIWYGATWIHAPAETEIELQLQGHPQTYLRFFLNGEEISSGEIRGETDRRMAKKQVTLRKGWNQVFFRGYCTGYPPFRAGLVLAGASDKLWTLRVSATPPAESADKTEH